MVGKNTRSRAIGRLKSFERPQNPHYFDEQALPSYLSPHAIVRHCFWRQVEIAASLLREADDVLDFGCGLGAGFLYWEQCCRTYTAFDSDPRVREVLGERVVGDFAQIEQRRYDAIVALNVLEHVEGLEQLLGTLAAMLRPRGRLIVSSPTEYWNYRLARRLGGWRQGYRGEYHCRNADDVERTLRKFFKVSVVARLYAPLTFFRIVVCDREHSQD